MNRKFKSNKVEENGSRKFLQLLSYSRHLCILLSRMNPKKLTFPFTWEERHPVLKDQVLFIPKHYDRHKEWAFPRWDDPLLFGREAPVHVEYCSGNGTWVVEKAGQHLESNWVAVEKRFDRVSKIVARRERASLKNLLVVCGDALTFTRDYLPPNSVEETFVNFPDPWPKDKHAKHRLFQKEFVEELFRVAAEDSMVTVVTDFFLYAQQVIGVMLEERKWASLLPDPFYKTEEKGYGASFFETLFREKGMSIYYLNFKKV